MLGIPCAVAVARPTVFTNCERPTTTVGMHCLSRFAASTTQPDVQDPQSPTPTMTASTVFANSSIISSGAPIPTRSLFRNTTCVSNWRSSSLPTVFKHTSPFGRLFHSSPIRTPWRLDSRSAPAPSLSGKHLGSISRNIACSSNRNLHCARTLLTPGSTMCSPRGSHFQTEIARSSVDRLSPPVNFVETLDALHIWDGYQRITTDTLQQRAPLREIRAHR